MSINSDYQLELNIASETSQNMFVTGGAGEDNLHTFDQLQKEVTENLSNLNNFNTQFNTAFDEARKNIHNYKQQHIIKVVIAEIKENKALSDNLGTKLKIFCKCYNYISINHTLISNVPKAVFIYTHTIANDKNDQIPQLFKENVQFDEQIQIGKESIITVLQLAKNLFHSSNNANNNKIYATSNEIFIKMCYNLICYFKKLCNLEIDTVNDTSLKELQKAYDQYNDYIKQNFALFQSLLTEPNCDILVKNKIDNNFNDLLKRLKEKNDELKNQNKLLNQYKNESHNELLNLSGGGKTYYLNKPISIMRGGKKFNITDVRALKQNFTDLLNVSDSLLNQFKNKNKILHEGFIVSQQFKNYFD